MIYTYYDKIYTVPGIGRAPPGLPGFTRTGPKGLLVGSTSRNQAHNGLLQNDW
jgi:hypothetical protein